MPQDILFIEQVFKAMNDFEFELNQCQSVEECVSILIEKISVAQVK